MSKILIVEDEPTQNIQLQRAAKGEGREIFSVENGQQAKDLLQANAFDIVVSDIKMETDLEGLEVLKVAKEKDIYTQVILITAYGTPETSIEAMRLGAFDYIERNSPGIDCLNMVSSKISQALEFRKLKLFGGNSNEQ